MTHHLPLAIREQIHSAHTRGGGGCSLRQVTAKVTLADFEGEEHRLIAEALQTPTEKRRRYVEVLTQICVQCGLVVSVECLHGMMYWTHRPGCSRYAPDDWDNPSIPYGLYQHYKDAIGPRPDPACKGCLLICPVCKADGT